MMNKMKSARSQLIKFLFILPLVGIMLLAFRNEKKKASHQQDPFVTELHKVYDVTDTTRPVPMNDKGYYIDVTDKKGECILVIKDKDKKEIERVPLTKWNEKSDYYENLYGFIMPPPPPPPPGPPIAPEGPKLPANVKSMQVSDGQATVILKDGTKENYNLENGDEKKAFEKKYGKMPPPPPPPHAPISVSGGSNENMPTEVYVNGSNTVTMTPVIAVSPSVTSTASVNNGVTSSINVNTKATAPVAVTTGMTIHGVTSTSPVVALTRIDNEFEMATETVLELRVYKSTTREKLDKLVGLAKDKGVELKFDKIEYNNKN